MATSVRLELNHLAIHEFLKGQELLDALASDYGERILNEAESIGAELARGNEAPEYVLERHVGRNRVRVTIATANDPARAAEARHHVLLRALDAGR